MSISPTQHSPRINDEEKQLVDEANLAYQTEKFEECSSVLSRLAAFRPDDLRLDGNRLPLLMAAAADWNGITVGAAQAFFDEFSSKAKCDLLRLARKTNLDNGSKLFMTCVNYAIYLFAIRDFEQAKILLENVALSAENSSPEFLRCSLYLIAICIERCEYSEAGRQIVKLEACIARDKISLSQDIKLELSLYKLQHSILSSEPFAKTSNGCSVVEKYIRALPEFFNVRGQPSKAIKSLPPSELFDGQKSKQNDQLIGRIAEQSIKNGFIAPVLTESYRVWSMLLCGKFEAAIVHCQSLIQHNQAILSHLAKVHEMFESQESIPLRLCCMNVSHQLQYNLGICFMRSAHYASAVRCFESVLPLYRRDPRIWLHLAQCLLRVDSTSSDIGHVSPHDFIGRGEQKKLRLPSTNIYESSVADESVAKAMTCIEKGLFLCSLASGCSNGLRRGDFPPCILISESQGLQVKTNLLFLAAYSSLLIGDYHATCRYASKLDATEASPIQNYLLKLYEAEALTYLDKISDAVSILDDSDAIQYPGNSNDEWFLRHVEEQRMIVRYNLAVAYAIRGSYENAETCLSDAFLDFSSRTDDGGDSCSIANSLTSLKLYLALVQQRDPRALLANEQKQQIV